MTYTIQADIEAMAEAIYKKMNSTGIRAAVIATPYGVLSKHSKRTFHMYAKSALSASRLPDELARLQGENERLRRALEAAYNKIVAHQFRFVKDLDVDEDIKQALQEKGGE